MVSLDSFTQFGHVFFYAPEKSTISATILCTHQTSIVWTLSTQNSSKWMWIEVNGCEFVLPRLIIHCQQGVIEDGAQCCWSHPHCSLDGAVSFESGHDLLLYPFTSVEVRSYVGITAVEQILEFQKFGCPMDLDCLWALSMSISFAIMWLQIPSCRLNPNVLFHVFVDTWFIIVIVYNERPIGWTQETVQALRGVRRCWQPRGQVEEPHVPHELESCLFVIVLHNVLNGYASH